ncbi:MAG: PilZ domain-containing protein [bacterium]
MTHTRRKKHVSIDRRIHGRRKKTVAHAKQNLREKEERREVSIRRLQSDRRRYIRFPVTADILKPVEFTSTSTEFKGSAPGIITQLSPGGLTMVAFAPIKEGTTLFFTINLPHFKINMIKGQVARVEQKGESYLAGIRFTDIQPDDKAKLNQMSLDYADCELKLSFGIKDVCFKECGFFQLCEKPYTLKK